MRPTPSSSRSEPFSRSQEVGAQALSLMAQGGDSAQGKELAQGPALSQPQLPLQQHFPLFFSPSCSSSATSCPLPGVGLWTKWVSLGALGNDKQV